MRPLPPPEDRRRLRWIGLLHRAALRPAEGVPVATGVLAAALLAFGAATGDGTPLAVAVTVAAALGLGVSGLLLSAPSRRVPPLAVAASDVALIGLGAAATPRGTILVLLCLAAIPLAFGPSLTTVEIAVLTVAAMVVAPAAWSIDPPTHPAWSGTSVLLSLELAISWGGMLSCVLAGERRRRAHRIEQLSASVRDLLKQTKQAQDAERRRLADLLHDDVLQIIVASKQDIAEALDGEPSRLHESREALVAASARLRETIALLRSDEDGASVGDALRRMAEETTHRTGVPVGLDVDATFDDLEHPVLLTSARDLLRTVEGARPSGGATVEAHANDDELELVVRYEDARIALGIEEAPGREAALWQIATRSLAVGGHVTSARSLTGEQVVRVVVPRPQERAGSPHDA